MAFKCFAKLGVLNLKPPLTRIRNLSPLTKSSRNLLVFQNRFKSNLTHKNESKPSQKSKSQPTNFVSLFGKEVYRIIKEDLLNFKNYKKEGKTYSKIDKKTTEEMKEKDSEKNKNIKLNTSVTSLMEIKSKKSFWEKLFSSAKETEVYGKYKGYSQKFYLYAKKNPNFKKFEQMRNKVSDSVEDFKEAYETTQNPLIWKMRDLGDRMLCENDTSFALRKVTELEMDFSVYEFLNELRAHILPVIIQGILNADIEFAKQTCEDNAYKTFFSYCKMKEHEQDMVTGQLIDVLDADFIDAVVHNKKPVLNFSCIGQHLETVQSRVPKPKEKPTYFVKNIFYKMSLTPEPKCPIFGWKFVDIQMQQVYALKSK